MSSLRKTTEAENDLIGIWLYSLDKWGIAQADHYLDQLEEGFSMIVDHPKIGKPIDYIRHGYHALSIGRQFDHVNCPPPELDSSAEAALEEALVHRFGHLGNVTAPLALRNDNGLVFTSKRFSKTVKAHGLTQEFITPYAPEQYSLELTPSIAAQSIVRRGGQDERRQHRGHYRAPQSDGQDFVLWMTHAHSQSTWLKSCHFKNILQLNYATR